MILALTIVAIAFGLVGWITWRMISEAYLEATGRGYTDMTGTFHVLPKGQKR